MSFNKILYVDIVAGAGAVASRVVISENFQRSASADGNLGNERHQIVRNAVRIFTD